MTERAVILTLGQAAECHHAVGAARVCGPYDRNAGPPGCAAPTTETPGRPGVRPLRQKRRAARVCGPCDKQIRLHN